MIIDFRARPEIEAFASITQNPIFNAFVQGRGYDITRRTKASFESSAAGSREAATNNVSANRPAARLRILTVSPPRPAMRRHLVAAGASPRTR